MRNTLVLFLLFLIYSCGSPQKHFKNGNFEKAFSESLKDLRGGKKDRKLKSILNSSFNELLKVNRTENERFLRSNLIEDWDLAYERNEELIADYQGASTYLDDSFDSSMDIIQTENLELLDNIVAAYLDMGNEEYAVFEDTGDKLAAQEAYLFYTKVASYNHVNAPNNLDVLIENAFVGGTIIVLVTADTWESRYDWDIDRAFRNLENESQGFYQVEFEQNVPNPDCVLEIDFSRLDIDRRDRSRTENFTEQVEDGYRIERDTAGRETRVTEYKNVSGQVQIIEETYQFNWDVKVDVNRLSNYCDFRYQTFTLREEVIIENYNWSGDERAIPSGYRSNTRNELTSRDEENIIEDLIDDAYRQIRRNYF